jgi:hypothetical protein
MFGTFIATPIRRDRDVIAHVFDLASGKWTDVTLAPGQDFCAPNGCRIICTVPEPDSSPLTKQDRARLDAQFYRQSRSRIGLS